MKATAQMGGLTRLVEIHRGWCNYCKGNAAWCDNCPEGGCALRDYLRSIESVRSEAKSREAVIREVADRLATRTVPDLPGWREAISSDIAYIRSIIYE